MASQGLVLVTGGSGYIGGFVIAQLLEAGFQVRTTIRNLGREPEVREALKKLTPNLDGLSFFAADLTRDDGWAEAIAGVDYIQHVASPFPAVMPKDENELIGPAREGALRVLRLARDAGVKRVVMTSSMAAIAYGHGGSRTTAFTEKDWTDETSPDTGAYVRSKTIAERAAWDFIKAEGGALELATINPSAVLGPILGPDFSTSILLVQKLLNGDFPGSPRLGFSLVDVRDVADLHVRAMTSDKAAGERFLAACDFYWVEDVARVLKADLGTQARKVPTGKLPSWLMRIVANFDPVIKGVAFELDKARMADNSKARTLLGWTPRDVRQSITDTARSLIREGIVRI
ncbi:3 beta-hydroxysteroid dehydrogenase/delta 5-_4-isomerase [Candidatus Phycosocius bacilliformis]|uniref:3 beta-hydroxysteroid dehydrogenase/delta 5->4-isomerase n=1 Tax=Candidatus Phycosocius bacilliformis TaxID=1445552 RepID=A0A2P2E9C5_9PROT|nr:aldehyde reductase [Candidatus Phycosocius bacilliformis]GBF57677.1 3 beta-hydroxysteroid dehydrogenase/delta 5->4-isomerase [Candidatus Phycosocius bacilliformis]